MKAIVAALVFLTPTMALASHRLLSSPSASSMDHARSTFRRSTAPCYEAVSPRLLYAPKSFMVIKVIKLNEIFLFLTWTHRVRMRATRNQGASRHPQTLHRLVSPERA